MEPGQEYFQKRGRMYRKMFAGAPVKITCRMCKRKFPNPIFQGSSIITKVCSRCVEEMMPKSKKKKQAEMNRHIKAPNSLFAIARR